VPDVLSYVRADEEGYYLSPSLMQADRGEAWEGDELPDDEVAMVERVLAEARAKRKTLLTDAEIDEIPEAKPLIEGIAFEEQLIALIGRYGTYKTFILLDFALCIALGVDWHGHRVRQGPVIYVYAEGASGIRKRRDAWKAAIGYNDRIPILFRPSRLNVADPAQVIAFVEEITDAGVAPKAIFIDTLARNMSGAENKSEDMKAFVSGCDTLRERLHASVFIAHHTGWEAQRSRGSTELPGSLDTEIFVERDDLQVTLKCTKQKEAAEFEPITLEVFPIAGSLALRPVAPTSAKLTRNELTALTVVQNSDGLTSTEWMDATDLGKSSFHNARRRLQSLLYVKRAKGKYLATDAGKMAGRAACNLGAKQVQSSGSREVQRVSPLLEGNVVPDRTAEGER
jgi:hypothetical protein